MGSSTDAEMDRFMLVLDGDVQPSCSLSINLEI
jgi:hypothetical protein